MDAIKNLSNKKKTEQKERHASRKTKNSKKLKGDSDTDDQGSQGTADEDAFISTVVYDDDMPVSGMTVDLVAEEERRKEEEEAAKKAAEEEEIKKLLPKKKVKKNVGDGVKKKMISTTTLVLLDSQGQREEKELDRRPITYSELQREIARIFATTSPMLIIQNERGEKIFPHNFIPSSKFIVRELLLKPPPFVGLASFSAKWEIENYHDAVHKVKMAQVDD